MLTAMALAEAGSPWWGSEWKTSIGELGSGLVQGMVYRLRESHG